MEAQQPEKAIAVGLVFEDAELRSARPPDHRLVFIAQLDKLLSQFLLVRTRPRVALGEQLAAALAGWEPFTLC